MGTIAILDIIYKNTTSGNKIDGSDKPSTDTPLVEVNQAILSWSF